MIRNGRQIQRRIRSARRDVMVGRSGTDKTKGDTREERQAIGEIVKKPRVLKTKLRSTHEVNGAKGETKLNIQSIMVWAGRNREHSIVRRAKKGND